MKQPIICMIVYLITSLQLGAQNCIDTINIKGYYVVKRIASELAPEINKNKNGTVEETMIPSRIAETSINPDVKEFDLYYFISNDKLDINPKIKDPHIKVWKK